MRLAFVIQRYGLEVNGGAELHCRWLAERLAQRHQVEVFATRALDYLEWKNHYPRGTEVVNGIPVHRSTVKRTRNARAFAYTERIATRCLGLADFPERGTRRDDLYPGLRTIGFERRVTIAFTVAADAVTILRVLYGGRDLEAAFDDERG